MCEGINNLPTPPFLFLAIIRVMSCVWMRAVRVGYFFFLRQELTLLSPHLFDDDLAVLVHGAVVDHAHYGHAQVTPDTEGDAEAQAAQDGDDVAAGQTEALTVAQRGFLLRGLPGPSILRQLDHLPGFLSPLYYPATVR